MAEIDYKKLSELVVKYQNGDSSVFEQIYNMTCRTAKFTALKILNNNESDADDVMQDCYIKVMEKINTLKDPSLFMSWFNMIVANQAKTFIRKNNPRFYEKDKEEDYSYLDDDWSKEFGDFSQTDYNEYSDNNIESGDSIGESKKLSFVDEASSEDYESFLPESEFEKEELRNTVMEMIDSLSEEKKTAVILYYFNNMTTKEISESVDISENTIKSRLVQAKKDISKAVAAYEKKNGRLLAVSPASLITWALKNSAVSTSITPFAASGIAAGTAAAAGTVAASTAAGTGVAAKIIAGVLITGIVTGGGIAGTRAVKNHTATEERTTTAVVEEHTESTTQEVFQNESIIPSKPIEEYTVADNRFADTYFESGMLKYGVRYSIQRYANKNGEVYSGRPVLNRKNYKASYEELLPAAKQNRNKYSTYISNSFSEINKKRVANGQKALVLDDILTEQANVRAEEIAWTERDTAVRPDGTSYTSLFDRNGYSAGSKDEIRKVDYSSYDTTIASILKDKKITGDFQRIGIGVAENPESEKFVFVVHLYSSEGGKADENISFGDKLIAWQNDIFDNIEANLMDTSSIDELERKGLEIPIIKDILEYDFHNDLIFEYIEKIIVALSDFVERIGE